ncbi:MAG TPA: penicillin-binding protein 2 [Verrucomicrobiota bacterium]|nr:penicillin-binding protein 2 [Verrucomicrobiota bacterium]HNU51747.1 penicillin-binding protein 2 [Verrucomicrobiota bacterium]
MVDPNFLLRMGGLVALVAGAFVALECRLAKTQLVDGDVLRAKAERYTKTRRFAEPWRGEIRDRAGVPVAVSMPVKTVYADLSVCASRIEPVSAVLAPHLGLPASAVAGMLRAPLAVAAGSKGGQRARSVVLRRQVSLPEWDALTNALAQATFEFPQSRRTRREEAALARVRRRVVYGEDDQIRVYPFTNLCSTVLGFPRRREGGVGWEGACGVERAFDRQLTGQRGICVSEKDAGGAELPFRRVQNTPSVDGNHVVLTLDTRLQQVAERILGEAVAERRPRSASILAIVPQTGEILVWASWPQPSLLAPGWGPSDIWFNHALGDRLEPGSTFKIVTLAAALNEGIATLNRLLDCEHGHFVYRGVHLRDSHPYGTLTVLVAFMKSSNIAFAKLAIELGPERMYRYITGFGVGQLTGLGLPGETAGWVPPPAEWTDHTKTRAGIGQGVALSQLQLTLIAAAIANDGCLVPPRLVRGVESPAGGIVERFPARPGRQVIRPEVARAVQVAMEGVASAQGTGSRAVLPDHRSLGKTGTAAKSNKEGYIRGAYTAWYVGCFPASRPQVVISVVFDEPSQGYYGGDVCAPVFRELAAAMAPVLGIAPDKGVTVASASRNPGRTR